MFAQINANTKGAPAHPPPVMFKIVLLQQWHKLADPQAEEAVIAGLRATIVICNSSPGDEYEAGAGSDAGGVRRPGRIASKLRNDAEMRRCSSIWLQTYEVDVLGV